MASTWWQINVLTGFETETARGPSRSRQGFCPITSTSWTDLGRSALAALGFTSSCLAGTREERDRVKQPLTQDSCAWPSAKASWRGMRSEYAMSMAWREEAFPAHEEDGVEELHEEMVPGGPADEDVDMEAVDRWEMSDGYLSRYHLVPRRRLFRPTGYMDMPVEISQLSHRRITKKLMPDGNIKVLEDDWHKKAADTTEDAEDWTGETIFPLKTEAEIEAARRSEKDQHGGRGVKEGPHPVEEKSSHSTTPTWFLVRGSRWGDSQLDVEELRRLWGDRV